MLAAEEHLALGLTPCLLLPQMARSRPVVTMMAKPGLHPQWHTEAKVLCNGEEVLVTSGTKPSYTGESRGRAMC